MKKHYFWVKALIRLSHQYRYKKQPQQNATEDDEIDFLEILEIEQGENETDELFYKNLKTKIAKAVELHTDNLKRDKLSKPENGFSIRSTVSKKVIINISRVG